MAMTVDDVRGSLATAARTWRGRLKTLRHPHALYLSCPEAGHTPADEAEAWQAPLAAFEAWCAQHPGERCELALSSAATLWHLAPHGQSDRAALATCWADAFAQWAHYMDVDLNQPEVMAHWQLQEAPASGFTLMAATPLALSAGLQEVAARHGVQLLWLGPWWVRGLARWLQALPQASDAPLHLHLAEPGWAWQAQAEPMAQPSLRWLRPWGRPSWRLTQLAWAPEASRLNSSETSQPSHCVALAPADQEPMAPLAACMPVPLTLLRGRSAEWVPA
jgi:hypothetical protein